MPELVIKYKNKKTLEALKSISKYFDFSIIENEKSKPEKLQKFSIIKGKGKINTLEMEEIFTNANLNAKKLREEAWK
ncbi:hypothetical protein I5M32_12525 [Pedobacter sp. SD-b]|uniref:Uncharacterized protein n=1 Tax=Pedobacter segetis TaxID=2793069 RepID=A0ABS1BN97_9SPHI|nr:hypothetical protein [Pedobacter segetis]MBK0383786.1 hypothetical protein [Pedobacter segetis]